jgi:hypothetical protein
MIVVSDNSPISALLAIDKIEILPTLFGEVIIPQAVMSEISLLVEKGYDLTSLVNVAWLKIENPKEDNILRASVAKLDKGEAQAIILAKQKNADILLIDERKGRQVADKLSITTTGLLGILVRAKQQSLINSLKTVIEEAQQKSNFRITDKIIQIALKMAGEI